MAWELPTIYLGQGGHALGGTVRVTTESNWKFYFNIPLIDLGREGVVSAQLWPYGRFSGQVVLSQIVPHTIRIS